MADGIDVDLIYSLLVGAYTPARQGSKPGEPIFRRSLLIGSLKEHRKSGEKIPAAELFELIKALELLQEGHTPPLLAPHPQDHVGPKGRTPLELACIDIAVRYRLAVKSKFITDTKPVRTILEAFGGEDSQKGGVNERTVQSWVKMRHGKVKPWPKEEALNDGRLLLNLAGSTYQKQFSRKARKGVNQIAR